MFDTMTLTKIVGGFCGALLIFLLGNWAAESLYHVGGGHGEGEQVAGYAIETGGEAEPAEPEPEVSFVEVFASADPGKGERVFNKCKACHKVVEGENGVGPSLYGVVGRKVDSVAGYNYSGALEKVVDVWTPQHLNSFLKDPQGYAPGTAMSFSGLPDIEDRANVIAYLDQLDGDTYPMPEVKAAAPAGGDEAGTQQAAAEGDATTQEASGTQQAAAETAEQTEQTAAEPEAPAAGGGESEFSKLVAAADPADGEGVYNRCRACHRLEKGVNAVGPHLFDVVGRDIASVEGFRYSDALTALDGAWTEDKLNAWLEDPRAFAPGNRMSFPGLRKVEDRASLVAYLKTIK